MEVPFWLLIALGIIINTSMIILVIMYINALSNSLVKQVFIHWTHLGLFSVFVTYWCYVLLN